VRVKATDLPRLSARFLQEERRRKESRTFRQEYMCEFVDDNMALFPRELIERSIRHDIKSLFKDFKW
jgi:phage FluMu gp28-like protein